MAFRGALDNRLDIEAVKRAPGVAAYAHRAGFLLRLAPCGVTLGALPGALLACAPVVPVTYIIECLDGQLAPALAASLGLLLLPAHLPASFLPVIVVILS